MGRHKCGTDSWSCIKSACLFRATQSPDFFIISSENPCCLSNISHILGSLITYLKNSLMVKWPVERLKVSSACSWHIPLFLKPARSGSPSGSLTTSKFRPYDLPFPKFSLNLYQKHNCFPLCCPLCE